MYSLVAALLTHGCGTSQSGRAITGPTRSVNLVAGPASVGSPLAPELAAPTVFMYRKGQPLRSPGGQPGAAIRRSSEQINVIKSVRGMKLLERIRASATRAGVLSAHADDDPMAWGSARDDYRQLCDELCVLEGWGGTVRALLYNNMEQLEHASERTHFEQEVREGYYTCPAIPVVYGCDERAE